MGDRPHFGFRLGARLGLRTRLGFGDRTPLGTLGGLCVGFGTRFSGRLCGAVSFETGCSLLL